MIDIWLLFSLLKPFVDILVQTYIETLRENPDENKTDVDDITMKMAWSNNNADQDMGALKYKINTMMFINVCVCIACTANLFGDVIKWFSLANKNYYLAT